MLRIRTAAKFFLYGNPLYRPARRVFLSIFDRAKLKTLDQARGLYGGLIGKGDLVFDVGANIGEYTDLFLGLGARVVAVEPNPECVKRISAISGRGALQVENVALGDKEGSAELNICDWDDISTLSEEWKRAAERSGRWGDLHWQRKIHVLVTTLDSLSKKHGIPHFVKIDTEGFDDKVLQGMSFRPPVVSFEFLPEIIEVAHRSLEILGDEYLYNYTLGKGFEFQSPAWLTASVVAAELTRAYCPEGHGDVFAKRAILEQ